jgi:spermidine/putrescine transport system permease protein|tara:strand:+ start:271 stop:1152 length:882 start_codon:yes stop_codon:yes gene_type:complete
MAHIIENLLSRNDTTKAYSLLSPSLLLLIFVFAFPIFFLVAYSFWTQDYVYVDTTLTLENYKIVVNKASYHALIKRSLIISSLTTLVTVLLAYPMAYFVAFVVKDHKLLWLIALTIPFWTSYLLRVFAWKLILGYNGVINGSLSNLGLIDNPLSFLLYNPFAVFVTLAHAWSAFAILPIYVSLEKIDRSLLEAAADLGDSAFRRFWRITFPLSFPGVLAASMIIFIPTTGDFITPRLVGGSEGIMVANLIQVMFGKANNWPLGSSLAIITMTIVTLSVICFVVISRWLISRIK